jgi:hypothetical protein
MVLTSRGHSIRVKVLRDQVEEKTGRIVEQVHRRRSSEPHLDHQKEYLRDSGSRYVSPIRRFRRGLAVAERMRRS